MENNDVYCIKCKSTNLHSDKKGFSAGKAVAGAVLTGGIGLLAGLHGSGKIKLTCLSCGHTFMLQDLLDEKQKERTQEYKLQNIPTFEEVQREIIKLANSNYSTFMLVNHYKNKMAVEEFEATFKVNEILKANNLTETVEASNKSSEIVIITLIIVLIVFIIFIIS